MGDKAERFVGGLVRGATAGVVGLPVDVVTDALNLGIALGGVIAHKTGLVDTPPAIVEKPVGGSEWTAAKMRGLGVLKDSPGTLEDSLGELAGSLATAVGSVKLATDLKRAAAAAGSAKAAGQALMINIPRGARSLELKDLIDHARGFARDNFAGKTVKVASDGSTVEIPWRGIKHSYTGKMSRNSAAAGYKLDELIKRGIRVDTSPDDAGRHTIVAVHTYHTPVVINGAKTKMRVIVREHQDGSRFYDHSEIFEGQGAK